MSPSLVELEALVLKVVNRPGGEVSLRRRVSGLPEGEALSAAIAWERVEPATLAHQIMRALDHRGPVPATLLQALGEERPSLLPRLRALALDLGLEPPHEPPGLRSRLVPLARALTDRLGADPRPCLDLVPRAPVADTWIDVLLDADAPTRSALLRLLWPSFEVTSREELRQRVVCILSASTLTAAALWSLVEQVGVAIRLPTNAHLDLFLEELGVAARTDGRLASLLAHLGVALEPEEARLFGLAELSLAWAAWEQADQRRRAEEERAELAAQIALLRAAHGRPSIEVERALDVALGVPPREAELLDPDQALDRERDLDVAEGLLSGWRLRWGFWAWPRAAALLARAGRSGLDAERRARAQVLGERLRPRLRLLLSGALGWAALTLLSAAVPLYVWGAVAAPPLAWLLRLLRPVALAAGVFAAGVGGQIALVADAPDQERVDQQMIKNYQEGRRGGEEEAPAPREPERWVGAAFFVWDERGRVVEQEPPPPPPPPPPVKPKPKPDPAPVAGPDQGSATQSGAGAEFKEVESSGAIGQVIASSAEGMGGPTGKVFKTTSIPDAPMELVGLSGGRFLMGAPDGEAGSNGIERPQHAVTVSAFAIGRSEVTQAQWAAVVTAAQAAKDTDVAGLMVDTSSFEGAMLPVVRVSWCDTARFANALSRLEDRVPAYTVGSDCEEGGDVAWNRAADGYRLPTEAEWEYAARAGTTTTYATGNTEADLARAGWYYGNSSSKPHEVCTAEAKPWGLCDLHGNVREWVWDRHGPYQNAEVSNPAGPSRFGLRMLRGGSWGDSPDGARSADRNFRLPSDSSTLWGFRLVLPVAVPEPG